MLPSTFQVIDSSPLTLHCDGSKNTQDTLKKEENMKKDLTMRLAVAEFMQETLQAMVQQKKKVSSGANDSSGAKDVIHDARSIILIYNIYLIGD